MLLKSKQEIQEMTEVEQIFFLAHEAIRLNTPFVERMMRGKITEKRNTLYVVVASGYPHSTAIPLHQVLASNVIGSVNRWKHPFDLIGESKKNISCRTGKPTAQVPLEERKPGETQYYGSEVVEGLVVACSGFQPELDEMVSGMIAMTLRGLMKLCGIKWCFVEPPEATYAADFIPEPASS